VSCGAFWERHWPTCARCFEHGVIVPWSERPRAAVDAAPGASTARALSRMAWQSVEQAAYADLRLGARALVVAAGPPGAGKSSWACRLADAVRGPALLVAAEEGLSPSLAARLLRCNVKRDDYHVLTRASVDAAVGYARQVKAVSMIVDSVQEAAWNASELRHVLEVVDSLVALVAVLQVTKAGLPAGSNAIQHEADVCVRVEAMRWSLTKSRYQDLKDVGGAVLPTMHQEDAA
jgi:predicted ATP-dependent serine protease